MLLRLALFAAILAGIVLGYQWWEHRIDARAYERGRSEVIAKWNEANAAAITKQHADQQRLQKQKDDAINEANEREKALRADVARVSAQRDGLRNELAASRGAINTASIQTLRARVTALTDVFEQCTERYIAVAQKADRHAADTLMFDRAWPTQ